MKVTTVRFGEDLWALLEFEAERAGVSVSQYIREAALARAAFAAGTRAGVSGDVLGRWADATVGEGDPAERRAAAERLVAALARESSRDRIEHARAIMRESQEQVEGAAALVGQARQTARRADEIRGRKRTT